MNRKTPYRELFECSPDAILILEGNQFVECNPAAVRMLGFPDKQTLLKRLHAHPADISPPRQPDGRDSHEKAEEYLAIASDRGSHMFEWTHLRADGGLFDVEVQLTVVERGKKPVVHVVWRDISERKRLEEELQRVQRLEAVGRLAGAIAHDFNNLLVVIFGYAELLEEGISSDKVDPQHVKEIQHAADRAAALTRQLLAFSRGHQAQSRPTDLVGIVDQLGSLLKRLIGEHIEVRMRHEDGPHIVVANPSELEQILVNLGVNARDAMPNGGILTISVGRRQVTPQNPSGPLAVGEYVALSVTDSGEGMTREQIDRAFDPFYTTKSIGKGTGLGLATVLAIAEKSGGRAVIESTHGRGTTVEVLFPLSSMEPVPLDERPHEARSAGGGETILLVEDEQAIRDLFESSLKAKGYTVHTAQDGQDALDRIAEMGDAIDLLVTDMVMPRVSGAELARRLSTTCPQMKVLFMSGYSEEANLSLVSEEMRTTVLAKPLTPKTLEMGVRRILDQK